MSLSWSDVESAVAKVLPAFGPIGAVAGGLISATLGTTNTPEAVMGALTSNPDAYLKLQTLLTTHKEFLVTAQLQSDKAQTDLDATEEEGTKWYDHWREYAGIVTVFGLFWGTIGVNLSSALTKIWIPAFVWPDFDTQTLISLMMGMLGLGYMHMNQQLKST